MHWRAVGTGTGDANTGQAPGNGVSREIKRGPVFGQVACPVCPSGGRNVLPRLHRRVDLERRIRVGLSREAQLPRTGGLLHAVGRCPGRAVRLHGRVSGPWFRVSVSSVLPAADTPVTRSAPSPRSSRSAPPPAARMAGGGDCCWRVSPPCPGRGGTDTGWKWRWVCRILRRIAPRLRGRDQGSVVLGGG